MSVAASRVVASIVIPTFNHAQWVAEAIDAALAQTVRCEVIVVDDGSTDRTPEILQGYGRRIRVLTIPHTGPSAARNAGIDAAQGTYLMLLDADDLIAPSKVQEQIAAFDSHVGLVLCDVEIVDDVRNRVELASARYRYAERQLGGWIRAQLEPANFIPIMSPLIRRSVLVDHHVRFGDLLPEDWHFWYAVAAHARARYLPRVLATYRKHQRGRNAMRRGVDHVSPSRVAEDGSVSRRVLNLGCGTPGTPSWHPQPGCVNLDRSLGWCFEDGLPQYADASVDAITISHAMMYLDEQDWPAMCREFARVLKPNGVVRITEDDTEHLESSRRGGWRGSEPAVTMTSAAFVKGHLERGGLLAVEVTATTTRFTDDALLQSQHGDPPDVFFVEGVKAVGVVFAPHADDEALFASYTLLRYRPHVVICCPSVRDYGDTMVREGESRAAVSLLGAGPVEQWLGGDLVTQMRAFDARVHPGRVWAPDRQTSHPDHLAVADAALAVFGDRVETYHTYDAAGKVTGGRCVESEPGWDLRKRQALACYETQMTHPRARVVFTWDLAEFYGEATR